MLLSIIKYEIFTTKGCIRNTDTKLRSIDECSHPSDDGRLDGKVNAHSPYIPILCRTLTPHVYEFPSRHMRAVSCCRKNNSKRNVQ